MNRPTLKRMVLKIEYCVYSADHFCYCENNPTDRILAEDSIHQLHDTAFVTSIDLVPVLEDDFNENHFRKIDKFLESVKLLAHEQV